MCQVSTSLHNENIHKIQSLLGCCTASGSTSRPSKSVPSTAFYCNMLLSRHRQRLDQAVWHASRTTFLTAMTSWTRCAQCHGTDWAQTLVTCRTLITQPWTGSGTCGKTCIPRQTNNTPSQSSQFRISFFVLPRFDPLWCCAANLADG